MNCNTCSKWIRNNSKSGVCQLCWPKSDKAHCFKCKCLIGHNNESGYCGKCRSSSPKITAYRKEYFITNALAIAAVKKIYRESHIKERAAYELLNKEKLTEQRRIYGLAHREEKRRYEKKKYEEDIHYKLAKTLRKRVGRALKRFLCGKAGSAIEDLGCSIEELKLYLESKFQPGMTWKNHTKQGWHIDHIIPLSAFELENREEFLKSCHYTNLQPLWASANYSKYGVRRKNRNKSHECSTIE